MLLNEYWDTRYWPSCAGLRECTQTGYESSWRRHIQPTFGTTDLRDIDGAAIDLWLAGIDSAGAARKAFAILRQMLRKAIRWGLVDRDATLMATPPRPGSYEPPTLDINQIRQLLQGFYGHPLEAWLICSVTLGLRTEEALGLEWSDIDLRSGRVRIQRGVQWVNGHETIVEPKTPLSRRTLILPRFAVLRLREIKGHGRLVGTLNPGQVARRYKSWCRSHDLPWVPPRNLRHSWASTALAAGVDVAIVSKALGHSSIATTARYYLRPDIDVLRTAQKTWEKALIK